MPTFTTALFRDGNNTAIPVPERVVEEFKAGKRIPVVVTINDYHYPSTVVVYGGQFLIPLAKEHREAAGIDPLSQIQVTLTLDTSSRKVALPDDARQAVEAAKLIEIYDGLAPSHQKEYVRWITEAKKPETRSSRIAKLAEKLKTS